jgi:hypothetical protein
MNFNDPELPDHQRGRQVGARGSRPDRIEIPKRENAVSSDEGRGKGTRRQPPEGRRFNAETAREAGRKSAEKRRKQAEERASSHDPDLTVTVPAHLKQVLEGLRDAAKKGSAPAAREYRALLAAYPTSRDIETLDVKQPEDMTPEEREQLRAWLLREYAKEQAGQANAAVEPDEGGHPR